MKKSDSKKPESKEDIEKLKRENNKLRQENELLKGLLKSNEGTSPRKKNNGYSTRYSREI